MGVEMTSKRYSFLDDKNRRYQDIGRTGIRAEYSLGNTVNRQVGSVGIPEKAVGKLTFQFLLYTHSIPFPLDSASADEYGWMEKKSRLSGSEPEINLINEIGKEIVKRLRKKGYTDPSPDGGISSDITGAAIRAGYSFYIDPFNAKTLVDDFKEAYQQTLDAFKKRLAEFEKIRAGAQENFRLLS